MGGGKKNEKLIFVLAWNLKSYLPARLLGVLSDSVGVVGPEICLSNKLSGEVSGMGP